MLDNMKLFDWDHELTVVQKPDFFVYPSGNHTGTKFFGDVKFNILDMDVSDETLLIATVTNSCKHPGQSILNFVGPKLQLADTIGGINDYYNTRITACNATMGLAGNGPGSPAFRQAEKEKQLLEGRKQAELDQVRARERKYKRLSDSEQRFLLPWKVSHHQDHIRFEVRGGPPAMHQIVVSLHIEGEVVVG